jgi:hypothetical protein
MMFRGSRSLAKQVREEMTFPVSAQAEPGPRPAFSRALLTPGPLPPLSPLGSTLLEHAATEALRYALYHLGLPAPQAPPFRTIRLRLYFDARELRHLLADVPGGGDVVGALVEPGGIGERPAVSPALGAAVGFHRVRLLRFRAPGARSPELREDGTPEELWRLYRGELERRLPRLGDALLADLIAALNRRAARAAGEEVPPTLSRAAWRLRTGRSADLRLFGPPDPLAPSWAAAPERAETARRALAPHPVPGHDRYRGRFRNTWRAFLDRLAPAHRGLARSAVERGLLVNPEDACFLPFERFGNLGLAQPTQGLAEELADLVRENRAEHESLRQSAEPLDMLTERQEMATVVGGERPEWEWAPLLPLP